MSLEQIWAFFCFKSIHVECFLWKPLKSIIQLLIFIKQVLFLEIKLLRRHIILRGKGFDFGFLIFALVSFFEEFQVFKCKIFQQIWLFGRVKTYNKRTIEFLFACFLQKQSVRISSKLKSFKLQSDNMKSVLVRSFFLVHFKILNIWRDNR